MTQAATTLETPAAADGRAAAAYALVLLSAVSFFNYLDRMVLSVLLEPIKLELQLTDTQLGLVSGLAFAVLYAVLGLPLARVADRGSRVKLLAACLALWSLMTAVTGLARGFWTLFLARVGVGVGEAGCVPAAHALIGDLYPPERRAFAISMFQAGGVAGLTGGMVITGLVADALGWRAALAIVGLPGVPLALLIWLTVREPRRAAAALAAPAESAWTALRALMSRPALRHLVLGLSVGAFGSYGLTQWVPAFFIRTFDLSLTTLGLWGGLSSGVGAVSGVVFGGFLANRLIARDRQWELWQPALAYGLGAPLYALAFLSPTWPLAMAVKFFAALVLGAGGGVALSALQSFAEPHRRATAIATVLFLSSLIGLGLGPLAVGALSDALTPSLGDDGLRWSLIVACAALVWAAAHFVLAARTAREDRL